MGILSIQGVALFRDGKAALQSLRAVGKELSTDDTDGADVEKQSRQLAARPLRNGGVGNTRGQRPPHVERGLDMEVTKRQKGIVDFIRDYESRDGVPPTMDEIAGAMGLNKKTVYEHLQRLKIRGVVTWRRYEARSIRILQGADRRVPFMGYIAAGRPIEAVALGDTIDVSGMLASDKECYVLRVKGDSMIDEQIREGDFVIIERRDRAENGETVVALLEGGEATLKKFYREKGRIRLQPANPAMKPIYCREVKVQGVVIGVVRKYK